MSKDKLYFESIDETMCYSLNFFLENAKEEGLKEITLVEAIPDNDTSEYIWCTHYGEIGERSECKKSVCPSYESKSGRGVCKHRGKLYNHGDEVTFKVPEL